MNWNNWKDKSPDSELEPYWLVPNSTVSYARMLEDLHYCCNTIRTKWRVTNTSDYRVISFMYRYFTGLELHWLVYCTVHKGMVEIVVKKNADLDPEYRSWFKWFSGFKSSSVTVEGDHWAWNIVEEGAMSA